MLFLIVINFKFFKKNRAIFKKHIKKKDPSFPVEELFSVYEEYHDYEVKVTALKNEVNLLSKEFSRKTPTTADRERVKAIKKDILHFESERASLEKKYRELEASCPNIVDDDVPFGNKEANQVISCYKEKPVFSFTPQHHLALLEKYNVSTFAYSNTISGSGFFAYEGKLAWVIYKLAMICLQHNEVWGFNVVHVPLVARQDALFCSGNLPRFSEELFYLEGKSSLLIPTAEAVLASYTRGRSFLAKELPVRLTSWTRCYRKEVGGYGSQERGLIRMHEFEKVEIFSFCEENKSEEEHRYFLACVESLLQKFDLHYQVVLLAAQDTSFASSKTYDIELWLPGQNAYKEVSSISNCHDFQARRAKAKYKEKEGLPSQYFHTLNGSSLALPRLMVALLEVWQTASGEIDFDGLLDFLDAVEKNKNNK